MDVKRKILTSILLAISLLAPSMSAQTQEHQWHEAKNISANFKAVTSQPDIDVFSAPNMIMIKVNQEVKVNIFTILGKLISSEHLSPGIYEFEIESHGVYIIKTDETSCKLAI